MSEKPSPQKRSDPRNWAELSPRMKALWIASFALATVAGVAIGIFLTFA